MQEPDINLSNTNDDIKWHPTMRLRWTMQEQVFGDCTRMEKVLQQMFSSDTGKIEWFDIPIINT